MMLDPDTLVMLRKVFDEVCAQVPPEDSATRSRVAEQLLREAGSGERSEQVLIRQGRRALLCIAA